MIKRSVITRDYVICNYCRNYIIFLPHSKIQPLKLCLFRVSNEALLPFSIFIKYLTITKNANGGINYFNYTFYVVEEMQWMYTPHHTFAALAHLLPHIFNLGLQTCHFTVGGWITHKDILASRFLLFCNAYRNVQEVIIGDFENIRCTPYQMYNKNHVCV